MIQKITKYLGTTSVLVMLLSVTAIQMDDYAFALTSEQCQEIKSQIKSGDASDEKVKQMEDACNDGKDNAEERTVTSSDRDQKTREKDEQATDKQRDESGTKERSEEQLKDIEGTSIPDWIRSNAEWWANDQIDDTTFVQGIQFLIKEGIVEIPPTTTQAPETSSDEIPLWVKNNAEWWSQHMISDEDFITGIEYLVKNSIIQV